MLGRAILEAIEAVAIAMLIGNALVLLFLLAIGLAVAFETAKDWLRVRREDWELQDRVADWPTPPPFRETAVDLHREIREHLAAADRNAEAAEMRRAAP